MDGVALADGHVTRLCFLTLSESTEPLGVSSVGKNQEYAENFSNLIPQVEETRKAPGDTLGQELEEDLF